MSHIHELYLTSNIKNRVSHSGVMSPSRIMSHTQESCLAFKIKNVSHSWVMSHIEDQESFTHIRESCLTLHIKNHVSHPRIMSHIQESCLTSKNHVLDSRSRVMSLVLMLHRWCCWCKNQLAALNLLRAASWYLHSCRFALGIVGPWWGGSVGLHTHTHTHTHSNFKSRKSTHVRHSSFTWAASIHTHHESAATHCNSVLQHTAAHCNTLQHTYHESTTTHCNTLQHTATHCNTRQHTATQVSWILYNTLQQNATHVFMNPQCTLMTLIHPSEKPRRLRLEIEIKCHSKCNRL